MTHDKTVNLTDLAHNKKLKDLLEFPCDFTFKVVGIGFDEELNEKESDRLYEEQCNFCSMYPELINELKTRGIIFEKVNYNEPDRKYNTKIKLKNNFENRNNKRKSKENGDES